MKRVTVWWGDAHGSGEKNIDQSILDRGYHKPLKMASTGWLVREDEVGVMIVHDLMPKDDEIGSQWDYRGYYFIPRGMIERIELLQPEHPDDQ